MHLRSASLAIVLVLVPSLLAVTSSAPSAVPFGNAPSLSGVRVAYSDFNNRESFTAVSLVNKSLTEEIRLSKTIVLGSAGRHDVLAVQNHPGQVTIPPLGEQVVLINSSFGGLAIATTPFTGARIAVFDWEGDPGSLDVSAVVREGDNGNDWNRTIAVEQGFLFTREE